MKKFLVTISAVALLSACGQTKNTSNVQSESGRRDDVIATCANSDESMTFKLFAYKTFAGELSGKMNYKFECNPVNPVPKCNDCMITQEICDATDAGEGVGYHFEIKAGGFIHHIMGELTSQVVVPGSERQVIDTFKCEYK